MKYLLVLQWAAASESEFDELLEMEEQLERQLGDDGTLDGHDFGSGEMNIFIETNDAVRAFVRAGATLRNRSRWSAVRAAS